MRKFLVLSLVLLTCAGLILAWVSWVLSNPNRFKDELESAIAKNAGLTVRFEGDLAWRLWPPFTLQATDLSVDWSATADPPLMRMARLRLNAHVGALFALEPKLVIQAIDIDGLRVSLVEDDNGANWSPPSQRDTAPAPPIPLPIVPKTPSGEALAQWTLASLTLDDARIRFSGDGEGYALDIARLELEDFSPGSPAHLVLEGSLDGTPIGLDATITASGDTVQLDDISARYDDSRARGHVHASTASATFDLRVDTFHIDTERIDTERIRTEQAVAYRSAGVPVAIFAAAAAAVIPAAQPLLPLDVIRGIDWQGSVTVDALYVDDDRFDNVTIATSNAGGLVRAEIAAPELFGGSAVIDVEIDLSNDEPSWIVRPNLANVDSRELMAWLDNDLHWVAPLMLRGQIAMTGNTERALLNSANGALEFDGGQGELDVSNIKRQMLRLAAFAGRSERVQRWPELLAYQTLTGNWRIDGSEHRLEMVLDNLAIDAEGTYDAATETLGMVATLTFVEESSHPSFDVNPIFTGLPVPMRCTGSIKRPKCRLDEDGSRKLIASALRGNANDGLRRKLDEKIDEQVPEEYRDAARSLLEALGRALEEP